MKMLRDAFEFVNDHPRLILLMAWPVFTAIVIGLILIVWQGPWIVSEVIQLKQLDILAGIGFGIIAILGLNQLAQSSTFFGKVGMKIGSMLDVSADMEPQQSERASEKITPNDA